MNSFHFQSISTFHPTSPLFRTLVNKILLPSATPKLSKLFQLLTWPAANDLAKLSSAKAAQSCKPTSSMTVSGRFISGAPLSSNTTANFALTAPGRKSTVWATTPGSFTQLAPSPQTRSAPKLVRCHPSPSNQDSQLKSKPDTIFQPWTTSSLLMTRRTWRSSTPGLIE